MIDRLDGSCDGTGVVDIDRRHVAQRAMGFEMGDLDPVRRADRLQGADLVDAHPLDIAGRGLDLTAPESPQVIEPGMGADRHAFGLGFAADPVHHIPVAGMKAAGHVCGFHDVQQRAVGTDVIRAETFGHVTVQIDLARHVS